MYFLYTTYTITTWSVHYFPMVVMWLHLCDVTLWHVTFPTLLSFVISPKEKEKKRNINNDLAVLPSHNKPLTKITPYTLKRITFTTSRASEIKARAKKALLINLHSEKYIRILQILETQLKRNRKGNSSFYYSPSCLSSMISLCGHNSYHLSVLYTSWTWPCDPALPLYFTPVHW